MEETFEKQTGVSTKCTCSIFEVNDVLCWALLDVCESRPLKIDDGYEITLRILTLVRCLKKSQFIGIFNHCDFGHFEMEFVGQETESRLV